jgi:hypothetical protein
MRHPQAESKEKTRRDEWFGHELPRTLTGVDLEGRRWAE